MSTNFNNYFTAEFSDELQKKTGINATASPQICFRTILRKLNIQLHSYLQHIQGGPAKVKPKK